MALDAVLVHHLLFDQLAFFFEAFDTALLLVLTLSLLYLTLCTTLFVVLDSGIESFEVGEEWIGLLKTLLITVFVAYFGSRGVEKFRKIDSDKRRD